MDTQAASEGPATTGGDRLGALDGMRAVAMLGVFCFHLGVPLRPLLAWGGVGYRVITHLDVGVEIFFVLSGLLVFRPFAAGSLGIAPAPGLREHVVRRAARIYPAYWLAFGVLLALGEIQMNGGFLHFGAHLALVQGYFTDAANDMFDGIQQAWTLVVEVSFYAVVPVIYLVLRRRSVRTHVVVLGSLTVTGFFLRAYTIDNAFGGAVGRAVGLLPLALAALGPGMLLAVFANTAPEALRRVASHRWAWWSVAAGAYLLLVCFAAPPQNTALRGLDTASEAWHRMLGPVIAVALVVPAAFGRPDGTERRGLARPTMVWLGTVSYGAYLWHQALLLSTDGDLVGLDPKELRHWTVLGTLGVGAAVLALVLLLAAISWYGLERPVQLLARRLTRRVPVGGATDRP